MLKKSVAKSYIWRTAPAYFVVIFTGFHSNKISLGDLPPGVKNGMLPPKLTLKIR